MRQVAGLPSAHDPGLGCLGLMFDEHLDAHRYPSCTPGNCVTFANTGVDGIHFSFLVLDGLVSEPSPVVITDPTQGGLSAIVGANLFDFLCLGYFWGYFGLWQVVGCTELPLEAWTNPQWQPKQPYYGFSLDDHQRRVLQFLIDALELRPWPNAQRFKHLQDRFMDLLEAPIEEL
jgi:hypothetical protein